MKKDYIVYEIIDPDESNFDLFCKCLQDWSEEMKEAGSQKARWCEFMKNKGLGIKLIREKGKEIGGMVQYIPSEYSTITGKNIWFIQCVWVHGYKQGRGDFRKKGMGQLLLKAAEEDCRQRGADGIAAWGVTIPVWMRSAWYKKHGYVTAEKSGVLEVVWKPFKQDAEPPKMRKPKKKPESGRDQGKVIITSFVNGICPAMNLGHERAKKAAAELGAPVEFRTIPTREPAVLEEWGIGDALYINGKELPLGPPPSYQKILKRLRKEVKKSRRMFTDPPK